MQNKRGKKPEDEENVDPNASVNDGNANPEKKKRKKAAKSSIASNIETLNAEVNIFVCILYYISKYYYRIMSLFLD